MPRFSRTTPLRPRRNSSARPRAASFEVDDLEVALEGQHVIYPPGSPSEGVCSAMIVHNGAPVELISFRKPVPSPAGANTPGS